MHYAVVRRRAKLTAQHRVIFAIPCNTITNNQMQYNPMQYDAMQYHAMQYRAMQSKTIQYMQYKEIPCNTLFKSFETSRDYHHPAQDSAVGFTAGEQHHMMSIIFQKI